MVVQLRGNYQFFTGTLYNVRFVDGKSQDDVSDWIYERLEGVIGAEPTVIHDGCPKCHEYKKELEELKKKKRTKAEE